MGLSVMAGIVLLPEPIPQHPLPLIFLMGYAAVMLACAIAIRVRLRRKKIAESRAAKNEKFSN
jgi:hypothetical protein